MEPAERQPPDAIGELFALRRRRGADPAGPAVGARGRVGAWTLPGGGLEFGEHPDAAAVRELERGDRARSVRSRASPGSSRTSTESRGFASGGELHSSASSTGCGSSAATSATRSTARPTRAPGFAGRARGHAAGRARAVRGRAGVPGPRACEEHDRGSTSPRRRSSSSGSPATSSAGRELLPHYVRSRPSNAARRRRACRADGRPAAARPRARARAAGRLAVADLERAETRSASGSSIWAARRTGWT